MHNIDSRYITVQYNETLHPATSVRLRTQERHPYPILTDELWVSFVSYVEKSDREISGILQTALGCAHKYGREGGGGGGGGGEGGGGGH